MRYDIILSPETVDDLRGLKAYPLSAVWDAIENYLRHLPTKVSKSRIRLRVDEIRVYYDVSGSDVEVLAILFAQSSKKAK